MGALDHLEPLCQLGSFLFNFFRSLLRRGVAISSRQVEVTRESFQDRPFDRPRQLDHLRIRGAAMEEILVPDTLVVAKLYASPKKHAARLNRNVDISRRENRVGVGLLERHSPVTIVVGGCDRTVDPVSPPQRGPRSDWNIRRSFLR